MSRKIFKLFLELIEEDVTGRLRVQTSPWDYQSGSRALEWHDPSAVQAVHTFVAKRLATDLDRGGPMSGSLLGDHGIGQTTNAIPRLQLAVRSAEQQHADAVMFLVRTRRECLSGRVQAREGGKAEAHSTAERLAF